MCGGRSIREISILSTQFGCEPKTALEIKSIFKNEKKKEIMYLPLGLGTLFLGIYHPLQLFKSLKPKKQTLNYREQTDGYQGEIGDGD